MVERLNQLQKEIKKARDDITVAEDRIKAVEEELKTADAKHTEELKKDRDYERANKLALQQQLVELLKEKNLESAADGLGLGSAGITPRPIMEDALVDIKDLLAVFMKEQAARRTPLAGLVEEWIKAEKVARQKIWTSAANVPQNKKIA